MKSGLIDNLKGLMAKTRTASDEVRDSLESTRKRIAELRSERGKIEAMRPTKEETVARYLAWARSTGVRKPAGVASFARGKFDPNSEWLPTPDPVALLVEYAWSNVAAGVRVAVDELYADGRPFISEEDRTLRLDDLDRQILDSELVEEAIIREAERVGFKLDRRADADPRAVLADASALP